MSHILPCLAFIPMDSHLLFEATLDTQSSYVPLPNTAPYGDSRRFTEIHGFIFRIRVGALHLQWLLFVGTLASTIAAFLLTWINVAQGTNFPGQLQRPLVTDVFYFISSAI